jgi:uncharacterized protein (DUF2147 family)
MSPSSCRPAALPPVSCRPAALPLAALVLALSARPASAQAATIAGTWFTEDSSSKVTITQSGNAYNGKVSWVKTTGAVDAKNSDASLRTRPILGIDILTGCTGDATSAKGCRLYAPKRGSTYDAELNLDKDGTLKVKVKAGIGGKTQTWTRAS